MRIVIFIFFGLILLNVISFILAMLSINRDEETGHDGSGTASAVIFLVSLLFIWILGIIFFGMYVK